MLTSSWENDSARMSHFMKALEIIETSIAVQSEKKVMQFKGSPSAAAEKFVSRLPTKSHASHSMHSWSQGWDAWWPWTGGAHC